MSTLLPGVYNLNCGSAIVSSCRMYRYNLIRFDPDSIIGKRVLWIMLNPSTADGETDDATIKRVISFSERWKFSSLEVVNLFAYRTCDPNVMKTTKDPIGELNDIYIESALAKCKRVVCAWGIHGKHLGRDAQALSLIKEWKKRAKCFGVNRNGTPKHPLFQRNDAELVPFQTKEEAKCHQAR